MDLREIGWKVVDWMHLAQDRDVLDFCEDGNEPSASIKCGGFIGYLSDL